MLVPVIRDTNLFGFNDFAKSISSLPEQIFSFGKEQTDMIWAVENKQESFSAEEQLRKNRTNSKFFVNQNNSSNEIPGYNSALWQFMNKKGILRNNTDTSSDGTPGEEDDKLLQFHQDVAQVKENVSKSERENASSFGISKEESLFNATKDEDTGSTPQFSLVSTVSTLLSSVANGTFGRIFPANKIRKHDGVSSLWWYR